MTIDLCLQKHALSLSVSLQFFAYYHMDQDCWSLPLPPCLKDWHNSSQLGNKPAFQTETSSSLIVSSNWERIGCQLGQSVTQLYLALCDLMDYSPPGSSVHGISQARIPEWVAILFSRVSSPPRDRTQVSCTTGGVFTIWTTRSSIICQERYFLLWPHLMCGLNVMEPSYLDYMLKRKCLMRGNLILCLPHSSCTIHTKILCNLPHGFIYRMWAQRS